MTTVLKKINSGKLERTNYKNNYKNQSLFAQANFAFIQEKYQDALNLYATALLENPELKDIIETNLRIINEKIKTTQLPPHSSSLNQKIIVYTCNIGDYEPVREPQYVDPTVDYILFTDNPEVKSKHWKVILLKDKLPDARRTSRLPKLLPHKYLPPHDVSVYVDANLELKTKSVRQMVAECMSTGEIALYPHAERDCVYDEIDSVTQSNSRTLERPELAQRAIENYESISYPRQNGLFENGFIFRKNTPQIQSLNEFWWTQYEQGAELDSFSFMYSLHIKNIDVHPIVTGTQFKKNPYVIFHPHTFIPSETRKKIAIVVHVFYLHIWDEIVRKLRVLQPRDFELFITGPSEILESIKLSNLEFEKMSYLPVENKGMDVLPFLTAVKEFKLYEYDAVLKLHTKNQQSENLKILGEMIFNALINNTVWEWVKTRPGHATNIYPGLVMRSVKNIMYGNAQYYKELCNILGVSTDRNGRYFAAGTMFWVEGKRTKILADNYEAIKKVFDAHDQQDQTGIDATPAHAFERVFSILFEDDLHLSFRTGAQELQFSVVEHEDDDFYDTLSIAGAFDHATYYTSATDYAPLPELNSTFNFQKYRTGNYPKSIFQKNQSDAIHFDAAHAILYGELENAYIYGEFSVPFYKLYYRNTVPATASAFVHYATKGIEEGKIPFPSYSDAVQLINRHIDTIAKDQHKMLKMKQRFEEKTPDAILSQEDYMAFHGYTMQVLRYIDQYYLIFRNILHRDHENLLVLATTFWDQFGETTDALEAMAYANLMLHQFDNALRYYQPLWQKTARGECKNKPHLRNFPYDREETINADLFPTVEQHTVNILQTPTEKICVYTAVYGDADTLPAAHAHCAYVDFICFSDRELQIHDWKVVVTDSEFEDDILNAKQFKILPHNFLQNYDASLYVDANIQLKGNLDELIKGYLLESDFCMWQNPVRDDLLEEVGSIISHRHHSPDKLIHQAKHYVAQGMERHTGMVDSSFIWRKHTVPTIQNLMDEWWEHIKKFSTPDQLSLCYLMWKNKFRPLILPESLGTLNENVYLKKITC